MQLTLVGAGGICILPQCGKQASSWRFFTDPEAKLMDAIAEQIIPADEWPGGRDSGVTNFIDKQLTGPYVRFQQIYRKGLAAMQETCLTRFQKKFEDLSWDVADHISGKPGKRDLWKDHPGQADSDRNSLSLCVIIPCRHIMEVQGTEEIKTQSYKMLGLDYP